MQNINYTLPVIGPTDLRVDYWYITIYTSWMYLLVMFLLPFA